MPQTIVGLSSMATRQLLAELATEVGDSLGRTVRFTSAGGVDIANRIRAGEVADLAVLADTAVRGLVRDGFIHPDTVRPLFVSPVVAAVPSDQAAPALAHEDDLRTALSRAGRIAYSTGPSGDALLELVRRWGLDDELDGRFVQAPPGVPVGALLAGGEADLGFQQWSELKGVRGVTVLGPLPGDAAITSVFSGGVPVSSRDNESARVVLGHLNSPETAATIRRNGMSPA